MLDRISGLLARCGSQDSVLPPTQLYNEGWLLRLVLDWFDRNRDVAHEIAFLPGARWYSEALLASRFLAERRGDPRAESYTHADGVIGHFSISPGERGEATVLPAARQLIVIEAKLGSGLSAGVKNSPAFDQAARNVACMAHMLALSGVSAKSVERLGFYVTAPRVQIESGMFADLVTKESVRRKVAARVEQYGGSTASWFSDTFESVLEHLDLGVIAWESILDRMAAAGASPDFKQFYADCLRYNPSRSKRAA